MRAVNALANYLAQSLVRAVCRHLCVDALSPHQLSMARRRSSGSFCSPLFIPAALRRVIHSTSLLSISTELALQAEEEGEEERL